MQKWEIDKQLLTLLLEKGRYSNTTSWGLLPNAVAGHGRIVDTYSNFYLPIPHVMGLQSFNVLGTVLLYKCFKKILCDSGSDDGMDDYLTFI